MGKVKLLTGINNAILRNICYIFFSFLLTTLIFLELNRALNLFANKRMSEKEAGAHIGKYLIKVQQFPMGVNFKVYIFYPHGYQYNEMQFHSRKPR